MPAIKTINLEEGRPSIASASSRLLDQLRLSRQQGFAAVKVIHGYGSHGVGGELRIATQGMLARMAQDGEIQSFVAGEDWRISDETTWRLIQRHRELKQDRDLGKGNKGISIVVL
jgi:DNA-nicking Smr family endonuclease